MIRNLPLLAAACGLAVPPLGAQVFNQPPGGAPAAGGGDTTIVQRNEQGQRKPATGTDIPMFDPSSEMVMFDGKAWNINDNRLLSATFQAYLNEPEHNSEQDQEYYAIMREIRGILSPLNQQRDRIRQAVALLPKAAGYPQDANLSESLLNAIFRVYLTQRNIGAAEEMIGAMKEESHRLRWRGDMRAQETRMGTGNTGQPGGGGQATSRRTGNNPRPPAGGGSAAGGGQPGIGTQSLAYEGIVLDLAELIAKQKIQETKIEVNLLRAKTEYHIFLGQLFMQRRFEHCVIACRFYDLLFSEGESTLQIKQNSDLGRLFGEGLGGNPTTGTLMNMANEAMHRVRQSILAFENHLQRDELSSAYKRLQEAFMIGQFLPEVRTIPFAKKRQVQGFERLMFDLGAAAEVKDFAKAQEVIDQLKKEATDYNTTKAQAYVTASTRASNMHIASAGMLFAEGKTDEAKEELTKAAELWPGNPKIDEVMAQTQDQMMQKNTLQKDFDRLVAERNFREIYKRKHEFSGLVGLTKDAARQEQLEKIIADILLIETAVAKTKELENSAIPGATFAAWEEIQQLVGKHPDDTDLRIRAEELSRKASDFVSALQRASEAQRVGNTGSALAWLLKARTIYPDSKRAKDGIQLILDRVLPADADLFDPPGGNFDGDALQPAASPGPSDPFN
jgi:tetratricopeptide (TPR) repeat protein